MHEPSWFVCLSVLVWGFSPLSLLCRYVAHSCNFFLFPTTFGILDSEFSFQASSVQFLNQYGFDYNKVWTWRRRGLWLGRGPLNVPCPFSLVCTKPRCPPCFAAWPSDSPHWSSRSVPIFSSSKMASRTWMKSRRRKSSIVSWEGTGESGGRVHIPKCLWFLHYCVSGLLCRWRHWPIHPRSAGMTLATCTFLRGQNTSPIASFPLPCECYFILKWKNYGLGGKAQLVKHLPWTAPVWSLKPKFLNMLVIWALGRQREVNSLGLLVVPPSRWDSRNSVSQSAREHLRKDRLLPLPRPTHTPHRQDPKTVAHTGNPSLLALRRIREDDYVSRPAWATQHDPHI